MCSHLCIFPTQQGADASLSVQSGDIIDENAEVVHHDAAAPSSSQTDSHQEEVRVILFMWHSLLRILCISVTNIFVRV